MNCISKQNFTIGLQRRIGQFFLSVHVMLEFPPIQCRLLKLVL